MGPGWAYRGNILYSRELGVDELGNPTTLNGIAQWFGTDYVFLSPAQDPTDGHFYVVVLDGVVVYYIADVNERHLGGLPPAYRRV